MQARIWQDRCSAGSGGNRQKQRYPNAAAAQIASQHRMWQEPGLRLYTFRCDACGGWHLTRQPPRPTV